MFKKILATVAAVLLGAGLSVVAVAAPASAHDANYTVNCTTLNVHPVSYETRQGNPKPNTLKVWIDGQPVEDTTFGSSFDGTYTYSGTTSHTWKFVIDAVGGTNDTQYDKTIQGVTTPCTYPTKSLDVQCNAVNVNWGGQLGTALHINMKVGTPNGDKTLSAYLDYNIAGGWGNPPIGVRYTDINGVQTTAPLTEQQVKSGFFSWAFPGYLGGATSYVIKWVQMDNLHFNQSELQANWKYCNFSNVTADAPSFTPATCDTAGTLVVPAKNGIQWTGGQNGDGPGTYNLVASAAYGYTITGETKFTVTVPPKKSGVECTPPPTCLDPNHVSYTYSNTQNSGVVTVTADPQYPNVTELCKPFWVTATSWTFMDDDSMWPQALDVVQYLDLIHSVGTYPYSAPVTCGQGDIYAQWYDESLPNNGQPIPPSQLNGPNNPWQEKFLHDMGFTGPAPTYLQHKPGCNVVTPVAPAVKTIDECGEYGSVVPAETEGIQYTVTGTGNQGEYKVTATVLPGYVLAKDDEGNPVQTEWTYDLGTFEYCVNPTASVQPGACYPEGDISKKNVFFTFDNTLSDGPVTFAIPSLNITQVVPAGQKVENVAGPAVSHLTGGSWAVTANGKALTTLSVAPFDQCQDELIPGDPKPTPEQCVGGETQNGKIWVEILPGKLEYTITNDPASPNTPAVNIVVPNDGDGYTSLPAGDYIVTVKGLNGFQVEGSDSWPYKITILPPENCEKIGIPASTPTQMQCVENQAQGSFTLPDTQFVEWYVNGELKSGPQTVTAAGSFTVEARITDAAKNQGIVFTDGTTSAIVATHEFVLPEEDCDPPTLAILEPDAFPTPGTCTVAPSFTLSNTTSEHGGVQWKIGEPQTNIEPGKHDAQWGSTVVVEATLVDPVNDGFADNQTEWTFEFPAKPADCGSVLAMTGATGGFVLWVAGAMLLLGGAGIFLTRRLILARR